ncbi:hypothetical protein RBB50_009240 [Rhinocladiella similis]
MGQEQMDFMDKFIAANAVPTEALAHFAANDFTSKYLSNPLYRPIPTYSRVLKDDGEDYFFSRTVATPTTIPYLVTLQLKDFPFAEDSPKGTLKTGQGHKAVVKIPENPDCIMLLHLGRPGVDGHPATIHGGVACAILDEMMGLCVMLHHQHLEGARESLYTAGLNVTYRAPVPTPNDVIVKCWLEGREGRKWKSRGQIINKDGLVMTEAEGLWVLARNEVKL